jgi:NodT family efflux transporter outer membrane factor (OMF) lipoprotein
MAKRPQIAAHIHRLLRRLRPRWLTLFALICAILSNSGCVATGPAEWIRNGFKVGPNYCKPPAPVAAEWIQARDADVQQRHIQDWWMVFQDGTLNSLIDTAYEQNLTLRVMGTRVLQARAQQAIASGNLFAQQQQITGLYANGTLNAHPAWLNFTGFNLSWEADLWGRIRRNIESANAILDATVENYDDALVTMLADVATSYVQYRIAQQRLKIARTNVRIQEDILALVQRQQQAGINKVTMLDVNQARTVLEQTRATIPALEIARGQANDTLCTLLGIPPRDLEAELGSGPDLGDSPMPNTPSWVAAGIPADLLRRRPDVRSAERLVAAQSAQIGVAEADFYPTVAVSGVLGYDTLGFLGFPGGNGFLGFVIPTFNWKILNYGRIVNNVRFQKARLQELIAAYQNKVLNAGREAQIPLRGFLRSQEQARDQGRAVDAAREALRIGRDQFRVGTIPFNTVFNLETAQVQQQDQLVVAQGNIALNLISVYRALGGGWEIRLQKDNCAWDMPDGSKVVWDGWETRLQKDNYVGGPSTSLPAPAPAPAASGSEQLPAPKAAAEPK